MIVVIAIIILQFTINCSKYHNKIEMNKIITVEIKKVI